MTFREILQQFRDESETQKEKGTKFERLIKRWLGTDPRYVDKLAQVWLWEEFPARSEFGGSDIGIDLVARTDLGEFWAIQCKCYAERATIDKPAVDSFFSTSSRTFHFEDAVYAFSNRLWISTTDKWGENALETLRNQTIPVNRIGLYELETSPVEWDALLANKSGASAREKGKHLMPHQLEALSVAHDYFKDHDRGKLIMACGTGKTYTALKIAEKETKGKGCVLFMVPSIALLGQTLNAWMADADRPIKAILICSDPKSNRRTGEDTDDTSITDLALPASTSVDAIVDRFEKYRAHEGLLVVFSTYQSIDVIAAAQKRLLEKDSGFGRFDYIVCDEAHRTTGAKSAKAEESHFVKIHDASCIKADHRLYMTATPRLYADTAKAKAKIEDITLWSMDDEKCFGREFFRVGFGRAVREGLLTDYKVLILTVSETDVPENIRHQIENREKSEIDYDIATKLIGCVNALSKNVVGDGGITREADPLPMRRALAFCSMIGKEDIPGTSKNIATLFPMISEKLHENLEGTEATANLGKKTVRIAARHIDGSMDSVKRGERIDWLKADAPEGECRVLSNVRCLSEGVDVPALDAVLFLDPRNSEVDVVQSVGRVMRTFRKGELGEKRYGYIIIPVVIPPNLSATEALDDNERFKVVWKILNALRAHDEEFNAQVNGIHLNKNKDTGKLVVVRPVNPEADYIAGQPGSGTDDGQLMERQKLVEQLALNFGELKEGIYAKLVEKVGDRLYWENWARKVGVIAQNFIARINGMVQKPGKHRDEFNAFVEGLRKNINPTVSEESAVEMLAQHLITRPVFDALFREYSFITNNSVSRAMQGMIDLLESQAVEKDTAELDQFYESVRINVGKIDNLEGRQTVIKTLYEKFFKGAFPLTIEKLGIVYTPVEIVDFIIQSVDVVLKKEFGRTLTDEGVHILDPFTGTGTFITRLLQSGLIKPEDMERKYKKEIHCNELVLLAYYIADVNIESVFHSLMQRKTYLPYNGICLTDTFELNEEGENDIFSKLFEENSKALLAQKKAPLKVIMGNPPYSVGQKSANDNAQNQHYPVLDSRIAETYAAESTATNKNALYDSYIKAFRWASDRLSKDGGVIAFVSNGAWIDGNAMEGFRKSLQSEFDKIYVFNLRGNCRTAGELRRKEGDGIFGLGSRTPIAITVLVRK
ncbi:MAG: hypothetical protein AUK31_05775 [Fibrobacteres bacterium CG2_30_45_31]|nr:MAG: hypothetical protein AUK31_05775 [Fibrobacteres bacterium CG2_30_45_31]